MATMVHLLGEVRVLDAHRRHVPPLDKRLGLLAYLACQGAWVEREKLAFLFWPDATREQGRTNLRGLLARSKELPFTRDLEAEPTRLRWDVHCDVNTFKRALSERAWAEAISCYEGELLTGASLDDAGELTSWLEMERTNLKEAFRNAVFQYANELASSGRIDEGVTLLGTLLARDPLDEEALQVHMRLLAENGQADRALHAYRSFRRTLLDELALEPTSGTERLARALDSERARAAAPTTSRERPSEQSTPPEPAGSAVISKPQGKALPTLLTPFLGRDVELSELVRLLAKPDCRLVTVTGAGGVGKTRLALQAARELRGRYADGAYFVPLDSVTSIQTIPASIATALGIELGRQSDPLAHVIRSLRDLNVLLVLDNFEQLLEGAGLVPELLQICPGVDLLITSRERLSLAGEWLFPLAGFSYPAGSMAPAPSVSLEDAETFHAVQFFVERCRQIQPSFALTEHTLPAVLAICRLVDGLPLGLELAAVWVRAMPIEDVAGEIQENVDFLSGRARDLPERHQSIRAAFEHSWKLLIPKEQEVLRKLSVFRSGFRREAADYVAGASIVILAALVDKSLLRISPGGRYDRHPLLHQYTLEKLAENRHEELETRNRHIDYFTALAERAGVRQGPELAAGLTRLEEEHDNLRAALEHAEAHLKDEAFPRLVASLRVFWRNHLSEGREWTSRAIAVSPPAGTVTRAQVLGSAGTMALLQGDYEAARAHFQQSVALARDLADDVSVALALGNLGVIAKIQGSYAEARSFLEEVLVSRHGLNEYRCAYALNNLGDIARVQGRFDEARSRHEAALALGRSANGPRIISQSLNGLGRLARDEGDFALARARFEESLASARASKNMIGVAASLDCLGGLARIRGEHALARSLYAEGLKVKWESGSELYVGASLEAFAALSACAGEPERAACLWGAAEALREAKSTPLPPDERARYEQEVAAARARLDSGRFAAAWRRGRDLGLPDAVARALEVRAPRHP